MRVLNKLSADSFTRRRLNNELSPKTVKTYLNNGFARDEKTYANGPAKGVRNILHNVAWNRYKLRNQSILQSELANHPEFKNIDDLRQLPEHRLASYKLMPRIKRVSTSKGIQNNLNTDPKFIGVAKNGGGYATIPAGVLDNKGSIVAFDPRAPIAKKSPLVPTTGSKYAKKFTDNTGLLHEAFETHYADKAVAENLKQLVKNPKLKVLKGPQAKMIREVDSPNLLKKFLKGDTGNRKRYQIVGMHMDPGVLTNEAKVVSSNPYKDMGRTFREVRDTTGEREMFKQHLGKDVYTQGVKPGDYRKLMNSLHRSGNVIKSVKRDFPYDSEVQSIVVPKKQGLLNRALSRVGSLFRR